METLCLWIGRVIVKIKLIYRFNEFQSKSHKSLFQRVILVGIDKPTLKYLWKRKGHRTKNNLEKEGIGSPILLDIETYKVLTKG